MTTYSKKETYLGPNPDTRCVMDEEGDLWYPQESGKWSCGHNEPESKHLYWSELLDQYGPVHDHDPITTVVMALTFDGADPVQSKAVSAMLDNCEVSILQIGDPL
ncbi:MAG: hypothetical protein ACWGQW_02265 [bacterium]